MFPRSPQFLHGMEHNLKFSCNRFPPHLFQFTTHLNSRHTDLNKVCSRQVSTVLARIKLKFCFIHEYLGIYLIERNTAIGYDPEPLPNPPPLIFLITMSILSPTSCHFPHHNSICIPIPAVQAYISLFQHKVTFISSLCKYTALVISSFLDPNIFLNSFQRLSISPAPHSKTYLVWILWNAQIRDTLTCINSPLSINTKTPFQTCNNKKLSWWLCLHHYMPGHILGALQIKFTHYALTYKKT